MDRPVAVSVEAVTPTVLGTVVIVGLGVRLVQLVPFVLMKTQ